MAELSPCFEAITNFRGLPEELQERLLAPWAAELGPGGVADLWDLRDRLPAGLVDALHRIHDLSDEAGLDQLLQVSGGALFLTAAHDPAAAAAAAFLDHPARFERALGRRFVTPFRQFRKFPGRSRREPSPAPEALAAAERRFGRFFDGRGRSPMCRIRSWNEEGERHFLVSHGRARRSDRAVAERKGRCAEEVHCWRPQQHDHVVYSVRTGRLRVSAGDALTVEEYVTGFGEALFGDPTWFSRGAVVSLDPLLHARTDVLRPVPGLLAVKLVELEVASRGGSLASLTLKGDDVGQFLDEGPLDPLAQGPLRRATLRLRSQSDGRWRPVSLAAPDTIAADWRRDGAVVTRYLEEKGFLLPCGQDARGAA